MKEVKDMTVSEALQHLEAKIDQIIEKLDQIEGPFEEPADPYDLRVFNEDPYVTPGSDCQV